MGVVTEHLFELIGKQVEEHKLVVWYDPDSHYADAFASFSYPNTTVAQYDGSFLQLRSDIDHLLNDENPPRLVVYVPSEQSKCHFALVELETAGVVVQPGQQPPQRNTRLSIVARNALKMVLEEQVAYDVEKQVETGKLTLNDVNALAQKSGEISSGIVSLVFDTGNPQEVALAFVGTDQYDKEIQEKEAGQELINLINGTFDTKLSSEMVLSDIRDKFARHVLMTELIDGLGDSSPQSLGSVEIAKTPKAIDTCVRLARTWRQLRGYRNSYVEAAATVEQDYNLGSVEIEPDKLVMLETVLPLEQALLRHVERKLVEQADESLLALAQSRLSCFWADVMPAIQAHWALIAAAAEVLLEANRVAEDLKEPPTGLPTLIDRYTQGNMAWCLLDTHHRHMESRWYNFDPGQQQKGLDKLIAKARQRYTEVGSNLSKHFVGELCGANHPISGIRSQREIFDVLVQPRQEEEKVAYLWVDALRYEMARELCEVLSDDFKVEVDPALATVPTITEIGMASLLPKASQGKIVSAGSGKLGMEIDGTVIKQRKDRIKFLKENAYVDFFEAKLDDLLPKPTKKIRDGIKNAQLVLITSQEIDELCEQDNITQARRQMDGVLNDLRRGVRVLCELGIQSVILTADHGHLFAEEVTDEMKIEAPGGDTADLHRRVWVGVGGTEEPSYKRTSLVSLGINSEFDIAAPYTFAVFKSKGGARAYFHGGMSPQEIIIPVVTLTPTAQTAAGPPTGIDWVLTAGTPKLTTRFFSIQIAGKQSGSSLFGLEPPKVRVEIRAKGKCVSRPVSASYGFEDAIGEVQLRATEEDSKTIEPNTVAVMIEDEITQKTVSVVLLDASSGVELATLDKIEVAIAF